MFVVSETSQSLLVLIMWVVVCLAWVVGSLVHIEYNAYALAGHCSIAEWSCLRVTLVLLNCSCEMQQSTFSVCEWQSVGLTCSAHIKYSSSLSQWPLDSIIWISCHLESTTDALVYIHDDTRFGHVVLTLTSFARMNQHTRSDALLASIVIVLGCVHHCSPVSNLSLSTYL